MNDGLPAATFGTVNTRECVTGLTDRSMAMSHDGGDAQVPAEEVTMTNVDPGSKTQNPCVTTGTFGVAPIIGPAPNGQVLYRDRAGDSAHWLYRLVSVWVMGHTT